MAATKITMWFDPVCPWAWLTSCWLDEVAKHRELDITWSVMSLSVLNEGRDLPENYREMMDASWGPARVSTRVALEHDSATVRAFYRELGRSLHHESRRDMDALIKEALETCSLPAEYADIASTDTVDQQMRASTQAALDLVGDDVGTPVIAVGDVAFFGPVITPMPTGDDAVRLFDGIVMAASVPGFYELKRTRKVGPTMPPL